jgi:hypothetical protein
MSGDRVVRQFDGRPRRHQHRPVGWCGGRSYPERPMARHSAGEPKRRWSGASRARRLGDAIDPAAFLFGRSEGEPELFL